MRDEILTGVCALIGWALLTWTLSALTSLWVWPISTGLLLLSLVGWRMIGVIVWEGLYSLTREDDEE